MFERICLVHYHEIGLKGRNRAIFENRLLKNMEAALSVYPTSEICRISGHLLVVVDDAARLQEVADVLCMIPGIVRVSQGWRCARKEDEFCKAAELALMDCGPFETFKVAARRSIRITPSTPCSSTSSSVPICAISRRRKRSR